MSEEAIIIFTAKSVETLLQEGGTSRWRLDRNHARQCTYAVCTRNAHADWTQGPEPHHTAFLVGKIKDVVPAHYDEDEEKDEGRFLIQFSEYARVNIPDAWRGGRNPVSYGTMKDVGIDPSTLKWEPMPDRPELLEANFTPIKRTSIGPLAEAKKVIAQTLGVSPDAIEITIRG